MKMSLHFNYFNIVNNVNYCKSTEVLNPNTLYAYTLFYVYLVAEIKEYCIVLYCINTTIIFATSTVANTNIDHNWNFCCYHNVK